MPKKARSSADMHSARIASAIAKLGGETESNRILLEWENHRRGEDDSGKREADVFMRGLIVGHSLSREEATKLFKIGRFRYDRLRYMDPLSLDIPNQPNPPRRPHESQTYKVTSEDKELIRLILKGQNFDYGYIIPCSHRSTPIYMEDPSVTLTSIYKKYEIECKERRVKCLSFETFRRIVKTILPTLHLGKKKTDMCNACEGLEDPQTSDIRVAVDPGYPDQVDDPFGRLNIPFIEGQLWPDKNGGQLGFEEEGDNDDVNAALLENFGGEEMEDTEADDDVFAVKEEIKEEVDSESCDESINNTFIDTNNYLHFVDCETEANIKTEIANNIKIELNTNEMEPYFDNNDELLDPKLNLECPINITGEFDGVPLPSTALIRRCQVCENPAKGHPKPRGKYCQQLPARDAEKYKLLKLTKHRDRQKTEKAKAKCRERQSTEAAKARCRKRQSTEEAKARCRKRQSTEEAKARCRERHRTEEAKVNCQERKRNQTEEAKAKDRERHRTEKAKSKCQERNQTGEDKDVPKEECRDTQQEEVVGVPQIPISETFLALNPQIYRKILPKPPSTEFS